MAIVFKKKADVAVKVAPAIVPEGVLSSNKMYSKGLQPKDFEEKVVSIPSGPLTSGQVKPMEVKPSPAGKKTQVAVKKEAKDKASTYFYNELVDLIGKAEEDVTAAKIVLAEYAANLEALHNQCDDLAPAHMAIGVGGEDYAATFGPRGMKTEVIMDNTQLVKLLKAEVFIKIAKVAIGDLKKYLTPEELVDVLKTEQIGPRKLEVKVKA